MSFFRKRSLIKDLLRTTLRDVKIGVYDIIKEYGLPQGMLVVRIKVQTYLYNYYTQMRGAIAKLRLLAIAKSSLSISIAVCECFSSMKDSFKIVEIYDLNATIGKIVY